MHIPVCDSTLGDTISPPVLCLLLFIYETTQQTSAHNGFYFRQIVLPIIPEYFYRIIRFCDKASRKGDTANLRG